MNTIRLDDTNFAPRRELARLYLQSFDLDRLLHNFRINAGLPSTSEPLGGWESPTCGLRGHFVGHFLSACSLFAHYDNDKVLAARARQIVEALAECSRADGYLSAFEEGVLDTLEREENKNVWAPYYTLHKILNGLWDAHRLVHDPKALELALGLARYIARRFSVLPPAKIDGMLSCTLVNPVNEFGGIGDVLYSLYEASGDKSILSLATLFDRDYFIGRLASGEDVLENLHANTHLPMVQAALHRYEVTAEKPYLQAARNFYPFLRGRTFANGASSSKATKFIPGGVSEKAEHWGAFGQLGDALTGGESESCCAHNTERILDTLVRHSGEASLLDHAEVLKFNGVLNAISSRSGLSQYHQPLGGSAVKKFSTATDSFWCCTGSGLEAMAEAPKNLWSLEGNRLQLNHCVSSTLFWEERQLTVIQRTLFPDELTSVLTFHTERPCPVSLVLRRSRVQAVKVNGETVKPGTNKDFWEIDRTFVDGDTVKLTLAAELTLSPLPGKPSLTAVMFGPILLAQVGTPAQGLGLTPENLFQKLVRTTEETLSFSAFDGQGHPVRFLPLFRIEDETYTVYADWGSLAPR